jgi:hypothetical protein
VLTASDVGHQIVVRQGLLDPTPSHWTKVCEKIRQKSNAMGGGGLQ